MTDQQIVQSLKALQDRQVKIITGTVIGDSSDATTIPVRLDNNADINSTTSPVIVPSLCGLISSGTRVSILTVPPAGMMIVGVINATYNLQAFYDEAVSVFTNPTWVIRRFYTADDTWAKPTSPLFMGVVVHLQGGGGGSGGTAACTSQTSTSGGGQGGGYLKAYAAASLLDPAPATIIVGTGGAGGTAGSNPGQDGLNSWFISGGGTTECSVPGGEGGAGGGAGPGTISTTGQTTQKGGDANQISGAILTNFTLLDFQQGDDGGTGWRTNFGDTGLIVPGYGGGSRMGAQTGIGTLVTATSGGPAAVDNKQIPPVAGWLFGGGASGRGVNDYGTAGSVAAAAGAAGADGCVVVEEIYRI